MPHPTDKEFIYGYEAGLKAAGQPVAINAGQVAYDDSASYTDGTVGGELNDMNECCAEVTADVAQLKSQISNLDTSVEAIEYEIENSTQQTVTVANTFTNFPFTMKKGKTYLFQSLTTGNTMSIRTRATEDGANIDSYNSIATGSPLEFVPTADANFIRVNSYLANGVFKVEEEGTIWFEIKDLKPSVPIVNLPSKLYATTGKELNVYFDNIVENSRLYHYDITCAKGKQMERGFSITPLDTDAGTYTFTLDVINDKNEVVASAESSLDICAASAGTGVEATILIMGDSTVNGTNQQIINDFSDDAMSVTTLGTRGTSPNLHEGRTGWTFAYYYGSATVSDITNPFYNPATGVKHFDADYYFTNSDVEKPDWFFIQLGINDVFTTANDTDLINKIKSMVSQCVAMITSIQSASPTTKIGLAITIPPNQSQDAFGKAYGCGQSRVRYKRNNLIWVKTMIETFGTAEYEAANVFLVPILTNLDTIYNMGLESTPVNARNTSITYESPIANGGVHPVESGYQQLADVYMAFLKAKSAS